MAAQLCGGDGGRLRESAGISHAAGGAPQTLDGVSVTCRKNDAVNKQKKKTVLLTHRLCFLSPQLPGVQQQSAGSLSSQQSVQTLLGSGAAMPEHRSLSPGGSLQSRRVLELLPFPQQGKSPALFSQSSDTVHLMSVRRVFKTHVAKICLSIVYNKKYKASKIH